MFQLIYGDHDLVLPLQSPAQFYVTTPALVSVIIDIVATEMSTECQPVKDAKTH